MSDVARLAAALATLAARTWPALAPAARARSLPALDDFVTRPSPSRFVAAARALADAGRRTRGERLDLLLGARTFARGAARLAEVEFVPDETRAQLVAQAHDAATGRRLGVLAVLLDAHAELAARLRGADAAHVHIDDAERRTRP
ncbi:MAG: hypothetical protein ACXVDD_05070 [Polyangia bacterium]